MSAMLGWLVGGATKVVAAVIAVVTAPIVVKIAGGVLVVAAVVGTVSGVYQLAQRGVDVLRSGSESSRYSWRVVDDWHDPELAPATMDGAQASAEEFHQAMQAGYDVAEAARDAVDPSGSVTPSLDDWLPDWVTDLGTVREAVGTLWGWVGGDSAATDVATTAVSVELLGITGPEQVEVDTADRWSIIVDGDDPQVIVSWSDLGSAEEQTLTCPPCQVERRFGATGYTELRVAVYAPQQQDWQLMAHGVEITRPSIGVATLRRTEAILRGSDDYVEVNTDPGNYPLHVLWDDEVVVIGNLDDGWRTALIDGTSFRFRTTSADGARVEYAGTLELDQDGRITGGTFTETFDWDGPSRVDGHGTIVP